MASCCVGGVGDVALALMEPEYPAKPRRRKCSSLHRMLLARPYRARAFSTNSFDDVKHTYSFT